jgi:hypothetical protein
MKAAETPKVYRTQSWPKLSQSPDKLPDSPAVNNCFFVLQYFWGDYIIILIDYVT